MPLNQTLRKDSDVLWTISLIQDKDPNAQTNAEFFEMANDIINTPTIQNVTLCLADRLQRFRFMAELGMTEEEATKKCEDMAKEWHQNNEATFEKLRAAKNFQILPWKAFLERSDYAETMSAIEKWYRENREFRNDVDGRIRQELRKLPKNTVYDLNQQTELLKKYLFEECAFQKFAATHNFHYEIYKTPVNKAMRQVKNNSEFVPPGYMVEISFTQFSPSQKKRPNNLPTTQKDPYTPDSGIRSSESFRAVFSKPENYAKATPPSVFLGPTQSLITKTTEFIGETIQSLPLELQQTAIEKLFQFTIQEIIPLYYPSNYYIPKV